MEFGVDWLVRELLGQFDEKSERSTLLVDTF